MTIKRAAMVFLLLVALLSCGVDAQDFGRVPGTVINYIESPVVVLGQDICPVYICDPSIVVLPNGDYVASHARFDWGSSAKTSGLTSVFRSSDGGEMWQHQATLKGILRASLFVHRGDLYLMGTEAEGKGNVIRKSTDNGSTWTTPVDARTGKLGRGGLGTPNNIVVHDGRIWSGAGRSIWSALSDANLMQADSWQKTDGPSDRGQPFGDRWLRRWGEGQAVASPRTGVYVLPKIRRLQNTALIAAASPSKVAFDASAPDAFPSLPGADKKFGVGYDAVSDRFYVLCNPVLPAHAGATKPELLRTTAAVVTSRDLIHWDVAKVFLFTENVDNGRWGEGFQYFNFDIDGKDMLVASRTAFDVGDGQRKPPRGHDSNLLTFHRIENFRNLTPEHYLQVDTDADQVLRFEKTQHQNAPLGSFTLGTRFAGAPLRRPIAIGQADTPDGCVYIREQGGRTLRFDAAGNFLDVVTETPIALRPEPLGIDQPPRGQRTWTSDGSGTWSAPDNWYYWGRPDTTGETAWLGTAIHADATITVDQTYTMSGLVFQCPYGYMLAGIGQIRLMRDSGRPAYIGVKRGVHRIDVPVELGCNLDCEVQPGCELHFRQSVDVSQHALRVKGGGSIHVHGPLQIGQGGLTLDPDAMLLFAPTARVEFRGRLTVVADASPALKVGHVLQLWRSHVPLKSRFDHIQLPTLPANLSWDTSRLYQEGTIRIESRPAAPSHNPNLTISPAGLD